MKRLSKPLLLLLFILSGMFVRSGRADSSADLATSWLEPVCTTGLRPQDSLWLIGTRHLGCPDPEFPQIGSFQFLRYESDSWQERDFPDFQNDQRDMTVFYVHGNRVDRGQVFSTGREAYEALMQQADQPASVRFVVWSWPSTQICGPKRDVQSKAARTNIESYYLASLLAQFPPDTEVGLLGFSFGARIISGSLHLLSGSELCGYRVADAGSLPVLHPRAVLMAAAMDRTWWLSGGFHSQCPAVADSLLVQFNPHDPVLKLYPRIDRRSRPQALGYTGFPWPGIFDSGTLQQQNVGRRLGKTHDVSKYFAAPEIIYRARQVLLESPLP
jgi:hypothetical protein